MRSYLFPLLLALALIIASGPSQPAHSEDDPQSMMRKMQEAMALTEHHKALARFAGNWDVEMSIAGMGTSKGTAKASWLFEGRWMQMTLEVPNFMGRKLESLVVMGYDKVKKAHVAVAVDNLSPNLKTMAGPTVDATGKVQVMYGEHDEYLTGEYDKPIKYVTRWIDKDTWVFEVWDLGVGENGKAVVTETFKRRP